MQRRYPIGAEVAPGGGVHFRVWAPSRKSVEVMLDGRHAFPLEAETAGYHAGLVAEADTGSRYRFRLDGRECFPDPVSRFQPEGPHGPSQVVDAHTFHWTDQKWRGLVLENQVMYEMHFGTFTREGTYAAAQRELAELADTGITIVELMPLSDFPGRWGWGYDGVGWFAPVAIYGQPDEFREFVDAAHRLGIGVILDVVYNHIGPDGNYLTQYAKEYFTGRYDNEWGDAINYDGKNSAGVREYVMTNARYWIEEYHLDGLRLDATQQIFDRSPEHIITALTREARQAAGERNIVVVAENESQASKLARPLERGGFGLDGLWNDDFHHTMRVALTGRKEAYYTDYLGSPQELISCARYGYLYQGQRYQWQKKSRGTPGFDLAPQQFVNYIQNHDQVANTARGLRLHELTSPGRYRAATAVLLLLPGTPMLFQGQEFAASSPFYFFVDHNPELNEQVRKGRAEFLKQFRSMAQREMDSYQIDPSDAANFERCKLDPREREIHAGIYALHKDLLRLRREDPAFHVKTRAEFDGAVLGSEAFVIRYFSLSGDRLLLVNFGRDLCLDPAPEPLLAPPERGRWKLLWSSEHPRYGGSGTAPFDADENWQIPGQAAVVLAAVSASEDQVAGT